jgi:hypothetical protein
MMPSVNTLNPSKEDTALFGEEVRYFLTDAKGEGMQELEQILQLHAKQYPTMEPTDAVKLIYQNEFGGGHLIQDEVRCLNYLRKEFDMVEKNPKMPILEDIGNGIVRVMLPALDESQYSLEQLGRDFIDSARLHTGTMDSFLEKLTILSRLTSENVFGFSTEELQAYLADYRCAGYPPVSHSEAYRQAYHPAYRIVLKKKLRNNLK